MNIDINDISIQITNRLMLDITLMCSQVTSINDSEFKKTPSYYMIRQLLCDTLEEYIKVLSVNYSYSPMEVERMKDKTDYWEYVLRGICHNVSEEIFNKKYFHAWDYENKDNYFGSRTFNLAVLDLNKIKKG